MHPQPVPLGPGQCQSPHHRNVHPPLLAVHPVREYSYVQLVMEVLIPDMVTWASVITMVYISKSVAIMLWSQWLIKKVTAISSVITCP